MLDIAKYGTPDPAADEVRAAMAAEHPNLPPLGWEVEVRAQDWSSVPVAVGRAPSDGRDHNDAIAQAHAWADALGLSAIDGEPYPTWSGVVRGQDVTVIAPPSMDALIPLPED